jgi:hypothetical protein
MVRRNNIMLKRLIPCAVALLALGLWVPHAQAVTIDLSSPQEGGTVHPGDMVEMTVTVTNDWDKKDIIHVFFDLTVEVGGEPMIVGQAKRRLKLEAGETVEETMAVEIPAELPIMEPAVVTIDALAIGRKSQTEDSDTLSLTVEP